MWRKTTPIGAVQSTADNKAPRLRNEPIPAADHRADVWVAQIGGRDQESKTARSGEGELALPVRGGGIQPVETPKTSPGRSLVASAAGADARRSGAHRPSRTTNMSQNRVRKSSDWSRVTDATPNSKSS